MYRYKDARYPEPGIYIIETGRCQILHIDEKGNEKSISVIGRNDSFGASQRFKIAVSYTFSIQLFTDNSTYTD